MADDKGYYVFWDYPKELKTDQQYTYQMSTTGGDMTGVTYEFKWEFTCDGVTTKETIASGLTSLKYTWTPTSVKFGPLMKKSKSGSLKLIVTTSTGKMTYSKVLPLAISDSVKPTISGVTITRTNEFNGRSISNMTLHKLSFNVAGLYGATQSVTVEVGANKYTKSVNSVAGNAATTVEFDIGTFDAGTSDIYVKSVWIQVTDSRGNTAKTSTSIDIYKYTRPTVAASVYRNANEEAYIAFTPTTQTTVAGKANSIDTFYARTTLNTTVVQTDLKTSPQKLNGANDIGKSYNVFVLLKDAVGGIAVTRLVLPSNIPVMDIGSDGNTVTFFGTSPTKSNIKYVSVFENTYIHSNGIYLTPDNEDHSILSTSITNEGISIRNYKSDNQLLFRTQYSPSSMSGNWSYEQFLLIGSKNQMQFSADDNGCASINLGTQNQAVLSASDMDNTGYIKLGALSQVQLMAEDINYAGHILLGHKSQVAICGKQLGDDGYDGYVQITKKTSDKTTIAQLAGDGLMFIDKTDSETIGDRNIIHMYSRTIAVGDVFRSEAKMDIGYNGQIQLYTSGIKGHIYATGNITCEDKLQALAGAQFNGDTVICDGTGNVGVKFFRDGEGGQIDLYPSGEYTNWSIDALNGNIRFYTYNANANYICPMSIARTDIVYINTLEVSNRVYSKRFLATTVNWDESCNALVCTWADRNDHNLVSRGTDGLYSGFGWEGSNSYKTVTRIRGKTCKIDGVTSTSDERLKDDFQSLDKWENFFDNLEPCAFKFKTGSSGRYHLGFKAQQVKDSLEKAGLTTKDFAGFVTTKYVLDEEEDPKVTEIYEQVGIKPGDDVHGLIYTEFVALQHNEIKKLKERVKNLETEINALKR